MAWYACSAALLPPFLATLIIAPLALLGGICIAGPPGDERRSRRLGEGSRELRKEPQPRELRRVIRRARHLRAACSAASGAGDSRMSAKAKCGTVKVTLTTVGGVSNARSFKVRRERRSAQAPVDASSGRRRGGELVAHAEAVVWHTGDVDGFVETLDVGALELPEQVRCHAEPPP
jgi:hypothetical protein